MAGNWKGYFKIVQPTSQGVSLSDNEDMAGGSYNNFSWYQRLVQGSASRMTRYREYDLMDNDVEVQRAMDTIAEEMTGNNPKTNEPLELEVLVEDDSNVHDTTILTAKAALRRWGRIHEWENRLFRVSRIVAKYGDAFFRTKKSPHDRWTYIHPRNVIAAVVSPDDVNKIIAWQVKKDVEKPKSGSYGMPVGTNDGSQIETELIDAREIVHFTLNDDMSDSAPFGESVLKSVYRAHKQKELLEDAIIIYRVQRAPERRVFYIDVGKMPPQRVKQYIENIKNEMKQKKVPNVNGGNAEVDSVYNPQSMSEDFFFAQRPDGRGSRVDTLPGGQGLGELADLEYFQRKVWRGLRVPASYMIEQSEGGQIWNDGKVGVAYIQELRFALFVTRIQGHIEKTLDVEFKKYLRQSNIGIDETVYRVRLPDPSNFGKYKEMEVDGSLLNQYTTADGIQYMSKRYILKRYLQLTDDEIIQNERMLREERGMDPESDVKDYPMLYGDSDAGGLGGGAGAFGGLGGGDAPSLGGGTEMGMDSGTTPGSTDEKPPTL